MNDRAREIHGIDPGDVMSDGELLAEIRAEITRVEEGGPIAPWSDRASWLAELRAQEAIVVVRTSDASARRLG